jgi:hypothetical protein
MLKIIRKLICKIRGYHIHESYPDVILKPLNITFKCAKVCKCGEMIMPFEYPKLTSYYIFPENEIAN